jgi:hypothetical protein
MLKSSKITDLEIVALSNPHHYLYILITTRITGSTEGRVPVPCSYVKLCVQL